MIFLSFTCLASIDFVSASCLIWSLRILLVFFIWRIVAISWSMWLWSAVAANTRLLSAEAMYLIGIISFALWYHVYSVLIFWVRLRLWYVSTNIIGPNPRFFVCLFLVYSSILLRHWHKSLTLIPHGVPSGWLFLPCMTSFCRPRTGFSHQRVQSNCQLVRMIKSACSFIDCWLWSLRSWSSCRHQEDAQGYHGTWLRGSRCIYYSIPWSKCPLQIRWPHYWGTCPSPPHCCVFSILCRYGALVGLSGPWSHLLELWGIILGQEGCSMPGYRGCCR